MKAQAPLGPRPVAYGARKTGPVPTMQSLCHSCLFTRDLHPVGETSGGSNHPGGAISLGQHSTHCLRHHMHSHRRQFFLKSLPLSERSSVMSSPESTRYVSVVMAQSRPQFVKFLTIFSVVRSSASHASISWWLAINVVYQCMTAAHSHSSGQPNCSVGTSGRVTLAPLSPYR